jgi:predicted nucleic acid-binding protein
VAAYFFDSSSLAKFYHVEDGTAEVSRIVSDVSNLVVISGLTVVEMVSVFAIKVRTGFGTVDDGQACIRRFQDDVLFGKFQLVSIEESHFASAARLLQQHAFDLRLRTLDALQLAVAIKVKQRAKLDYFVAADKVLCQVAEREGLAVINPEQP